MEPSSKPQIVVPPETLANRVGKVAFDATDFASVESLLAEMVNEHSGQVLAEVETLCDDWEALHGILTPEGIRKCFMTAHDLSGYGETLGFPLITMLGRSLCRFLKLDDVGRKAALEVIGAHISALRIVASQKISGDGGEIGAALVKELDRAIAKFDAPQEETTGPLQA